VSEQTILVASLPDLVDAVEALQDAPVLAVDIETQGINGSSALDMVDSEVVGIGLADGGRDYYVDFPEIWRDASDDEKGGRTKAIWACLWQLLDTENRILISHNTPFDMYLIRRELARWLAKEDPWPACRNWWDTLSMAALCDENIIGVRVPLPFVERKRVVDFEDDEGNELCAHWEYEDTEKQVGALSLKALSMIYLGRRQRLWDEGFMTDWSPEERADYGGDDVRNCYDLGALFARRLQELDLLAYYEEYVAPVAYVVETMQRHGLYIDQNALERVQGEIQAKIDALVETIQQIVPPIRTFKYGLKPPWTKKRFLEEIAGRLPPDSIPPSPSGKPSVTAKVLQELAEKYPDLREDVGEGEEPFTWDCVREVIETPFNPNSGQQFGEYLQSKGYRLPLTQTGIPSTTDDTLKELAKEHPDDPVWEPYFGIKKLEKLRGTYVDGMLNVVWPDGTIHPEWHSSGTATGRFSCTGSSQNKHMNHKRGIAFQTVPRPDTLIDEGWPYNPREWVVAPEGYIMVVADLSQAEVRMLAVRSACPVLTKAVNSGEDVHKANAQAMYAEVFDEADEHAQKTMRGQAKTTTFGTMYGIGDKSLAEQMHCDVATAKEVRQKFYETFYGVNVWKDRETEHLLRFGYTQTLLGRRRTPVIIQRPPRVTAPVGTEEGMQQAMAFRLWRACYDVACTKGHMDPTAAPKDQREARAVRQAINFEIQGSVGELMNWGMLELVRRGYRYPGHCLVGQVHDEVLLLIEDTEEAREQVTKDLKDVFEPNIHGVQFVMDIAMGPSWACGKE